jgi:hypothetical protein
MTYVFNRRSSNSIVAILVSKFSAILVIDNSNFEIWIERNQALLFRCSGRSAGRGKIILVLSFPRPALRHCHVLINSFYCLFVYLIVTLLVFLYKKLSDVISPSPHAKLNLRAHFLTVPFC